MGGVLQVFLCVIIEALIGNGIFMQVKAKGRRRHNQKALDIIREAGKNRVFITKKQWKLVRPPGAYILRKRLGAEYVVQSLINDEGWVIKKV